MKQRNAFRISVGFLVVILGLLLIAILSRYVGTQPATTTTTGTTAATNTTTQSNTLTTTTQTTTTAPTTPPTTTLPSATTTAPVVTVPPTTAAPPTTTIPAGYIGSLYSREHLETLDRTMNGCASWGAVNDQNRPVQAIALTERFRKYDAHFIGEDNNCVYLSFNCGYEYNNLTTVILDKLKEKNVKVVFFVNRHFVRSNPQLIQRIIDEGHILGNHCTNHPELPTLSIDGIVEEIMTLHNYVLEEFGYEMKLFRPPSGYYSEQVLAIAQSLGYRTYNFSYTYADWYTAPEDQPNPESTLTMLTDKAHSGAIYQLHSVSSTNANIIDRLIDNVRAKGFTFALLP